MSITIKRRHKKHAKHIAAHASSQIIVQLPITITGSIAIQLSNVIPIQISDPNITPYFIIPAMIFAAIEGIRYAHRSF